MLLLMMILRVGNVLLLIRESFVESLQKADRLDVS